MSMAMSIVPQKATCCLATASNLDPVGLLSISRIKHSSYSFPKHKSGAFSGGLVRTQNDSKLRKMNVALHAKAPGSLPFDLSHGAWKAGVVGAIMTIILSLSKGIWGPLLQFKEKIDKAIDEAEDVADNVEDVADDIENVAERAASHLPKGKLRDVAGYIDKVAEQIETGAHIAGEALQKVEDVGEEMESFFDSNFHLESTRTTTTEKIGKAIDEAEDVADFVAEVADDIENVAERAASHLPKGKLREAAGYIDKVAEQIETGAHIAGEALQKVEDVGKEMESFFDSNFHLEDTRTATTRDRKSRLEGNKIVDSVQF